jgi:16S rRNA (cytidine1402-2'-O)-methyltransferase
VALATEENSLLPPEEQPLAPGLYLVATPIGNLEDITLRALRILRTADLIACEDTRQTQKLLNHFNIPAKTISYHQHNELSRSEDLLATLREGGCVALVSDAGMPGISDPGTAIVNAAIAAGINIFPVPGPNAALSALTASGLDTEKFLFLGFLPPRNGERRSLLETYAREQSTLIFYEAPHRILGTLADIESAMGPSRRIVLARELTKLHEEFLRGTVTEIRTALSTRDRQRGEMVLLIAAASPEEPTTKPGSINDRINQLAAEGIEEKDALKQIARERNLSKSEAYRELQRERAKH